MCPEVAGLAVGALVDGLATGKFDRDRWSCLPLSPYGLPAGVGTELAPP